jgi:hypothetical protein
MQLNRMKDAKVCYEEALKRQPRNQLALENLDRIAVLSEKGNTRVKMGQAVLDPSLFLDVPGKTKTVTLVNLGQKNHLAELTVGQEIELKHKKRRLEVRNSSGDYIGSLPDDLSKRLMFFIDAGSTYKAYIKDANLNKVVVFIKEDSKAKKVAHYSSFPQNIQSNLDQMNHSSSDADSESEDEGIEQDEIEVMAENLIPDEDREGMEGMEIPNSQEEDESEE